MKRAHDHKVMRKNQWFACAFPERRHDKNTVYSEGCKACLIAFRASCSEDTLDKDTMWSSERKSRVTLRAALELMERSLDEG